MSSKQKLIILNGFSAGGKSTIAQRFVDDHPLAINIEGDEIISMIGRWKDHYDEARKCVFPHTKAMIETHLGLGYDVVVPYLLVNPNQAEEFEKIARNGGARFFEMLLFTNKKKAIERLMKRGRWGEEGLPDITEKDRPEIEELYNKMEEATSKRKNTMVIKVKIDDIDHTYKKFLELIEG